MYTAKLKQMPDLGKSLRTLMDHVFINYNGALIEKAGSTYIWAGKCHPSLQSAQNAVDAAKNIIANSLNRA